MAIYVATIALGENATANVAVKLKDGLYGDGVGSLTLTQAGFVVATGASLKLPVFDPDTLLRQGFLSRVWITVRLSTGRTKTYTSIVETAKTDTIRALVGSTWGGGTVTSVRTVRGRQQLNN